jgi:transglutaminase-like putative cysteine protease
MAFTATRASHGPLRKVVALHSKENYRYGYARELFYRLECGHFAWVLASYIKSRGVPARMRCKECAGKEA